MLPDSLLSKRPKVFRSKSSCTCTRPMRAAARNSLYSISSSLSVSRQLNKASASAPSTWKFSSKTLFISSIVMVPLFCRSMAKNCSCNMFRSSLDRDSATMLSKARRKAEARANLRRLRSIPGSRMRSSFTVFMRKKGCSNASLALSRQLASTKSFCTKSLAWGDSARKRCDQCGCFARILVKTSSSLPKKGGAPVRSMYAMTPQDHKSALSV
mmetsp:Transcript_39880/g.62736  ORF Transcript_39880/g.62736 Transcript_39880/m.62736 type:complete len:213 (-) Transcript_39880:725-1363(-)